MENTIPISARMLSKKFGSASHIYLNSKESLRTLWEEVKDEPNVKAKFDHWLNTFRMLYDKPDSSLFIDHTYLVILAKIITYLKFNNNKSGYELAKIIDGKYFTDKGITNILEEDFSAWLLHPKIKDKMEVLFLHIFNELSDYDFFKIDEDVFGEIYEDIVERKERHKAGEYYTPEWLVQLTLNEVIDLWEERKGEVIPKILDPACGSGTFLYRAIKILIQRGVSIGDIIKNVAGIDINPLAAIIAKANYLIAIGDFIEDIEDLEKVTLPVHTKDSLKIPDLFDYNVKIEKCDIIVGNPPWVVMRSMKNEDYQNFLKHEVLKYHLLENKDVHLFTQMELATLFFCKCADLYLKRDGIIAFVMPRSVLAGTIHHINFREFKKPPVKLIKIIDLEDVTPLFNMPSCVLIGLKDGITEYPVLLERFMGELSNRSAGFYEAKAELVAEAHEYIPPDFSARPSYYYDKFKVGASIFPRSLYFVDFIYTTPSLLVAVKTSEEIFRIVKDPWRVALEGNVEEDFIYATLLAWEMIPFGYVRFRPVVLPIKELFNGYELLDVSSLEGNNFLGIAEWLKKAEAIWSKRRTKKSEKRFPSLLDRLNYNNLLTTQNLSKRYVVLYNATGTNLVSCVIDKPSLPSFMANGKEVKPKGFIVDVKTWFFETESEMEAYYLSAIFNSGIISKIIKPLQPRGLFGARAIHRRPLLFPIPEFDGNNDMHVELVDISKRCHEKMRTMKFAKKNNIRAEVRKKLEGEIKVINHIVSKLLNMEEK
ncbi:MAG: SAM-dependent DNA methyltransferase [Methanophagales archaeon]|nr:SAM-dependent DNA methyltransferase [Methanophagales archaeon]